MFEINNKVRVIKQRKTKNYEGTCGKEGFVVYIDYQMNKYGVEFPDIKNPASSYGRYYFEEGELELVENKIPTLEEIKENGLKCCIHTKTQAEADMLDDFFDSAGEDCILWDVYKLQTVYSIEHGEITGYISYEYIHNTDEYGDVYKFEDVAREYFATGGEINVKKENTKNMTVTITEGARARKPHEKGKPKTIETISTTVETECGQATTTCDRSNYYDIYTGALIAAAKITATKSEEALLLFKTAIDMWGNEMCFSILKALANRAFVNEKFDWAYKKWRKAVAYEERQNDIKARTCFVCGKVFKTVEEARAHEKWHEDCKTHKIERREAKRRLAEAEREGRISDIMTELLEERNKELTAPVNEATTTEQN